MIRQKNEIAKLFVRRQRATSLLEERINWVRLRQKLASFTAQDFAPSLLVSYYYLQSKDMDAIFPAVFTEPYPRIFLDSGAFSATSLGVPITWQAYGQWVRKYKHWFQVISNLDTIGNTEATQATQEHLETLGLSPLPVFHVGSPWGILEKLCSHYPYLAFGGMVPYLLSAGKKSAGLFRWVTQAMRIARKTHTRVHGFGCTTPALWKQFPWYSLDSSAWTQGYRYGQYSYFAPGARFLDSFVPAKSPGILDEWGFPSEVFQRRHSQDRIFATAWHMVMYSCAFAWISRGWNKHGVETNCLYLAEKNPSDLSTAHAMGTLIRRYCFGAT